MTRIVRPVIALAAAVLALAQAPALAQESRSGKRGYERPPRAVVMREMARERARWAQRERERARMMEDRASRRSRGAPNRVYDRNPTDQEIVRRRTREGRMMSLGVIKRRVVAQMPPDARYLGVDIDTGSSVYIFKFMRDSSVIWVNVDGRTGRIIR